MKSYQRLSLALAGAIVTMGIVAPSPLAQADDTAAKATKVEAESLPEAITSQVGEQFPNAKIGDASLIQDTYYEVELIASSGEVEASYYADGTKAERGGGSGARGFGGGDDVFVDFDSLPDAVQDSLAKSFLLTEFESVERDEKNGIVSYKARYQVEAGGAQARLTEDGHLIEVRSTMFPDALPEAIQKKIKQEYSDAEIADATEFQETYYKISIRTDSAEKIARYFADGTLAEGRR